MTRAPILMGASRLAFLLAAHPTTVALVAHDTAQGTCSLGSHHYGDSRRVNASRLRSDEASAPAPARANEGRCGERRALQAEAGLASAGRIEPADPRSDKGYPLALPPLRVSRAWEERR